ncbi:UdgX family uracil-DNA binding protein [Pseudotabrizicola formosa]|uniref:UdgX family uracil-DNA binding protein n=1 Tax=Pseudotabrizicola formosa TaxID=2030009 RepID=UPI000CD2D631|nr:UdgX family uracil-DNA binding protein [Pseudotabrizicola formosa]
MRVIRLPLIGTVAAWRGHVRQLARRSVPPEAVLWQVGEGGADLFAADPPGGDGPVPDPSVPPLTLPREVIGAIETALCHSDPQRFARAYALALRLFGKALRWGDRSDAPLRRLLDQEKAVRRDIHKMHAFVRFRDVTPPDATRRAFAAWFEPEHAIVEAAAPFFARRFGDMDWVIATPSLTARFEDGLLTFAPTAHHAPPPEDATEKLWCTYFASIFNPARLMVSAMTSEMPKKYWKNLPEAALIPDMIRAAPARARGMQEAMPTLELAHVARLRPQRPALTADVGLEDLKPALDACRRCPIGACATQGVPGEGPRHAPLMIVGEQPGDAEDLAGRPFVGPAGQVFDRCATAAGLDRAKVYVTNAVKHFKFQPRGKRRLHERPTQDEISLCRWWLDLERQAVKPGLLVAMGATAAAALTGDGTRLTSRRGRLETTADGSPVLITLHPSYCLRLPDRAAQVRAETQLTDDLRLALQIAAGSR